MLSDAEIAAFGSSKTPEWGTPPETFGPLAKEFDLNLDVCATPFNTKCERFYTKDENGLLKKWDGRVWMNPPYGREIGLWVAEAYINTKYRGTEIVVALLPARTDTDWFHCWVYHKAEIRLLHGRVKFIDATGKQTTAGLFPSMVAIFRGDMK